MEEEQKDTEKRFFERQLVIFRIEKEEFGVDINDVREIIKMEDITHIPRTEDYIIGVINLRGKIIVVVDLAKKLGMPAKERDKNTRVIITEFEGNTVGMVVDECNEVLRITGDKIKPAPSTITKKIDSDYLQGVGILEDRILILLDLGKVFENKDVDYIKQVEDQHSGQPEKKEEKKKVLIVDDSSMMRGTLKSYIDADKYDVIEAGDGEEAVLKVKEEKPSLILLDIKMPKLDGIGALKQIKEVNPKTVVVMETSVYEDETKELCLKSGAKDYLKKPISKKQIVDILKSI
ncbi:MAG: chemotaxis protein CheV [Candidatus Aenigmarchaeota archaeon]|nr:chemotaxis protein CheV [Candidatus Aenigmarchaeota archaeon]